MRGRETVGDGGDRPSHQDGPGLLSLTQGEATHPIELLKPGSCMSFSSGLMKSIVRASSSRPLVLVQGCGSCLPSPMAACSHRPGVVHTLSSSELPRRSPWHRHTTKCGTLPPRPLPCSSTASRVVLLLGSKLGGPREVQLVAGLTAPWQ